VQENIVHASDSPESAAVELKRFLRKRRYSVIHGRLSPISTLMMSFDFNEMYKL
jgi:hypothetical protein